MKEYVPKRVEEFDMPKRHLDITDKYFLRAKQIAENDRLDATVMYRVFARSDGKTAGIDEALAYLANPEFTDFVKNGGRVWTLPEESPYRNAQTMMLIKGRFSDIVTLETGYLGITAGRMIKENFGVEVDAAGLKHMTNTVRQIKTQIGNRDLFEFGARHQHWNHTAELAKAAYKGGATATSTDIGARAMGLSEGIGTMPHALIVLYSSKYGKELATLKAIEAFDKYMPKNIPRIALVDTFGTEITDSLACAEFLEKHGNWPLAGVRADTSGDALGENCTPHPNVRDPAYQIGNGTTIELYTKIRNALNNAGFKNVKNVATSGFGRLSKVSAFVSEEGKRGYKIFDSIGAGDFADGTHTLMPLVTTSDIVKVNGKALSKVGREYYSAQQKNDSRVLRKVDLETVVRRLRYG